MKLICNFFCYWTFLLYEPSPWKVPKYYCFKKQNKISCSCALLKITFLSACGCLYQDEATDTANQKGKSLKSDRSLVNCKIAADGKMNEGNWGSKKSFKVLLEIFSKVISSLDENIRKLSVRNQLGEGEYKSERTSQFSA